MTLLLLLLATFVWAFCEASVFFVPADVVVVAGAALFPLRWWTFPLEATAGALAGGAMTWALAVRDPEAARRLITRLPGHPERFVARVLAAFGEKGWPALLAAGFSGKPYKIFAFGAAEQGRGLFAFLGFSLLARLPRFALAAFAVAWISRRTGRPAAVAAAAVAGALALTALAIARAGKEDDAERL